VHKKKEILSFTTFLIIFLILLYYHNKQKTIEIEQEIDVIKEKIEKPKETEKTKDQEIIIVKEDEPVIESITITKKNINLPEWNITSAESITAEFIVLISQNGYIKNIELSKSSGLYTLDKILYNEISELDITKTEVKTILNIKYKITYE
jgi:hypothetical protein